MNSNTKFIILWVRTGKRLPSLKVRFCQIIFNSYDFRIQDPWNLQKVSENNILIILFNMLALLRILKITYQRLSNKCLFLHSVVLTPSMDGLLYWRQTFIMQFWRKFYFYITFICGLFKRVSAITKKKFAWVTNDFSCIVGGGNPNNNGSVNGNAQQIFTFFCINFSNNLSSKFFDLFCKFIGTILT